MVLGGLPPGPFLSPTGGYWFRFAAMGLLAWLKGKKVSQAPRQTQKILATGLEEAYDAVVHQVQGGRKLELEVRPASLPRARWLPTSSDQEFPSDPHLCSDLTMVSLHIRTKSIRKRTWSSDSKSSPQLLTVSHESLSSSAAPEARLSVVSGWTDAGRHVLRPQHIQ